MSLSVCLLTNEPAPRVANLLAPIRALADEIVVAADERVDEETLAGYAALADRLVAIEFHGPSLEAHLAWLHAQCKGDWILRLDGDEVLSASLIRSLPRLLSRPEVRQYWIRRHWLFRDRQTRLDDVPWATDHNNRLVRNDGTLRFSGLLHTGAEPAGPSAYVEEPIYHLELLLNSEEARRAKAVRYEVARPHLVAPPGVARINEAYYLPELRPTLRTRSVPPEDSPSLDRAMDLS